VGVERYQKRDYMAWYNPILLIIDAMFLASYIMILFLAPLISEVDATDPTSIESAFNAYFVLLSLIIQDGILIWMVWHQVVRRRVIPLSEMGLARKQLGDTSGVVKLAVAGVGLGLALFTIATLIELGQASLGFAPADDAAVLGPSEGDLAGYLTWLVSGCLIAPVSEEFFFRGYAFHSYNKRYGLMVGLFVSSIGFAAIHTNIYALLPIFVAGAGFALAFWRTGSLVPPMVAHATNNFLALTLMYIGFYG
jgi:membrane protease YdiL (CAAX protease family)